MPEFKVTLGPELRKLIDQGFIAEIERNINNNPCPSGAFYAQEIHALPGLLQACLYSVMGGKMRDTPDILDALNQSASLLCKIRNAIKIRAKLKKKR